MFHEEPPERLTIGSMSDMAKDKATITVDREKVRRAKALTQAASTSAVIDVALDRLIRAEVLRRDVEAYRRAPMTDDELPTAQLPVHFDLDDADVDYDLLYGESV